MSPIDRASETAALLEPLGQLAAAVAAELFGAGAPRAKGPPADEPAGAAGEGAAGGR